VSTPDNSASLIAPGSQEHLNTAQVEDENDEFATFSNEIFSEVR
jgi:hypothetical protein